MAGRQLLAVSGARWAWYSTEEHLPDDLEPIGTHLGPKQQTDKLFFSTRLIAPPGPLLTTTNSYDLTNFGSFSIFWPRLVAHRAWCTTQEHLLDDSRPIGTHLGPKHGTGKFFFQTRLIATTSPLLSTMNNYNLPNFGSFSNLWPRLVAHRVWYTTQEDLPDDFRPIGTHSGPKEQTNKLFF